jgi:hypothetical protein
MDYIKKYPETLEEAVESVISILSEEDRNSLKNIRKEDLIELHFSLGLLIRNNLGLWGDNKKLLETDDFKDAHPDNISSVIMKDVWDKLNEK